MLRISRFFFLILPLLLFTEELEVRLATQSQLKPLYLSRLHVDPSEHDWRYFDDLRNAMEFDLNMNGYSTVQSVREEFEEKLNWPDVRKEFDLSFWKRQKVPYIVAFHAAPKKVVVTLLDLEKEFSKRIEAPISGRIEEDRRAIHRLSDAIAKDLFGAEGIASLRILYSQRAKRGDSDWHSEIWISDSDGHGAKQILRDPGYALSPGFFPKQTSSDLEYYYVSYKEGQSKIYRSSLSQTDGTLMLSLRGNQALPALAPKGGLLAFITDVAGRPDLFLQSLDKQGGLLGKARQIYSQPRATQASPTFSPDGKQIAFVSDKDGPPPHLPDRGPICQSDLPP